MPTATVHVSRKKSRRQHPWIFSNEIESDEGNIKPGDTVRIIENGSFLGSALYSPHSLIRARIFSREETDFDAEFLIERIRAAQDLRRRELPGEDDFRLLYGESDGVPGLVIDKYGAHFVIQAYTTGIDLRLEMVVAALRAVLPTESAFAANDFPQRELEGLARCDRVLFGEPPESVMIRENGVKYVVNIRAGQKTGFYFDQRRTRRRVREVSPGRRTLDIFCYSGGFAVSAALGGATLVTAIDTSEPACGLVARNAALNQVGERITTLAGDAFTVLRELHTAGRGADLIVLDPPSLIRRRRDLRQGLRAYRDINHQAMRLLAPDGILVSCSCSHHLQWQDFLMVLAQAAQGCGREFRVIERIGAGPDHPVLLGMPETEYLRCVMLQAM